MINVKAANASPRLTNSNRFQGPVEVPTKPLRNEIRKHANAKIQSSLSTVIGLPYCGMYFTVTGLFSSGSCRWSIFEYVMYTTGGPGVRSVS